MPVVSVSYGVLGGGPAGVAGAWANSAPAFKNPTESSSAIVNTNLLAIVRVSGWFRYLKGARARSLLYPSSPILRHLLGSFEILCKICGFWATFRWRKFFVLERM